MVLTDKLTAIADAIRGKTGGTEKLTLDQMPVEISNITGGGDGGVIVPLSVTENGTYEVGYEIVTEEWDNNTEYDRAITYQGVTLRVKKSDKLQYTDDLEAVCDAFRIVIKNESGEIVEERDYSYLYPFEDENGVEGFIDYYSQYAALWVKSGAYFNTMFGTDYFEDNSVYVSDYPSVISGECRYVSLTALGKRATGFLPVTVNVQPNLTQTTITQNGVYTPEYFDGYSSVTVDYSQVELAALVAKTIVEIPVFLTTIADSAFSNCKSLARVRLHGSASIKTNAFYNCTALKQIITDGIDSGWFGENVINAYEAIFPSAFAYSGLSGHLRVRTGSIRAHVFENCKSLESVDIGLGGGVGYYYVSDGAFRYCTNLKRVLITFDSVRDTNRIDGRAFDGCTNLESLAIGSTNVKLENPNFPSNLKAIYVPEHLVESYKTAENWSIYSDIISPFPKYDIVFHGAEGLQYYDKINSTWVDIVDGTTINQVSSVELQVRNENTWFKVGTTEGGAEVARICQRIQYDSIELFPSKNETWYITESTADWYKNEIQPLESE